MIPQKRIKMPHKQMAFSLLIALGICNQTKAQEISPQHYELTSIEKQVKTNTFYKQNKSVKIWGTGAAVGAAEGEFQNAFSIGALDPTKWSAISISQSNGTVTPGAAFWERNTTGVSQGAYAASMTAINSPSQANGAAIFDSDFLDNGGTPGAFGQGTSPGNHQGELISPRIDLTGYTDSNIAVNFHCKWRNYQTNDFSVQFSTDDGSTWSSFSIMSSLPAAANVTNEGTLSIWLAGVLQGVSNLSQCRIKFTYEGYYYYTMIDDVSISLAIPIDLRITEADPNGNNVNSAYKDFQITNNAAIPANQIGNDGFRFGVNVKNLGFRSIIPNDNVQVAVDIQRNISGVYTSVYQQSRNIDSIYIMSNGTAFIDSLNSTNWAIPGIYRVKYAVSANGGSPQDSAIHFIEINNGTYMSKVHIINSLPDYSRATFPGGTTFNRFEWGATFDIQTKTQVDSISYIYFIPNNYVGSGNQTVKSYIYEWVDDGSRVIDGSRTGGELVLIGAGQDNLTSLTSNGSYGSSTMNVFNIQNGLPVELDASKHYYISIALEGSGFTSDQSIWFGSSTYKNYALNMNSNGLIVSPSSLIVEDGTGVETLYWTGFGVDNVPSLGVHISTPPPCNVSASITTTGTTCSGNNDGEASLSVGGGTTPYNYSWSNGSTKKNLTGLIAGTYTVTVSDANGCSAIASAAIYNDTTACVMPSNLRTTLIQHNSARLKWDAVPGALGYRVYSRVVGTSVWANTAFVKKKKNYIDAIGISSNTNYEWTVKVKQSNSVWSNTSTPINFTTLAVACVNPTNISVGSIKTDKATLTWTNGSNSTKNKIRYRQVGSRTWLKKTTSGTKSIAWLNGLNAFTLYEFQMKAVCALNSTGNNWTSVMTFSTQQVPTLQRAKFSELDDENTAFLVYPNPTAGNLTLELESAAIGKTVQIMNVSGSVVSSFNIGSLKQELDVSNLANGVYFIRYEQHALKFILNR